MSWPLAATAARTWPLAATAARTWPLAAVAARCPLEAGCQTCRKNAAHYRLAASMDKSGVA